MEEYELFQKLHFIQVRFEPNGSVIITLTKMKKKQQQIGFEKSYT